MDGVTVQAERIYSEVSTFGAVVTTVIFIAVLLVLCFVVVSEFKKKCSTKWQCLLMAMLIALFGTAVCYGAVSGAKTVHKDLIVTIDDSVKFNEFYRKYEVIDCSGHLYTVRELPTEEIIPVEAGDE